MSSTSGKWEAILSKDEVKSIAKKAKPQKPKKMLHFTQQNGFNKEKSGLLVCRGRIQIFIHDKVAVPILLYEAGIQYFLVLIPISSSFPSLLVVKGKWLETHNSPDTIC